MCVQIILTFGELQLKMGRIGCAETSVSAIPRRVTSKNSKSFVHSATEH